MSALRRHYRTELANQSENAPKRAVVSRTGLSGGYSVLLIDPPWSYTVWNKSTGSGRSAEKHYHTSPSDVIAQWDIPALMAKNSILAMWVTSPMLEEAFALARCWGMKYNTVALAWAKTNPRAIGRFSEVTDAANWFFGLGHSTRSNVELVLSFKRGKGVKVQRHDVPQLIVAPRGRHSQKPDEANRRLELLYPGPYCEVFARREYPNWTCYGDALDGRDIRDVLKEFAS